MGERWFHERTDEGWVIRDENRGIVATVPDEAHEREDDAKLIASAPCVRDALARATRSLEETIRINDSALLCIQASQEAARG